MGGKRTMMEFDANYSRKILLRLVIALVVLIAVVVASREFIFDFFIRGQVTPAGPIINGVTLLLFAGGLFKVVSGLLHYAREEAALARFIRSVENEQDAPEAGIDRRAIIHRRYSAIQRLSQQNTAINHGAHA